MRKNFEKNNYLKYSNKGFSLVELIIVIVIIAVLVVLLAPQFLKQVEKSREARDLQNISEYKSTIETIVAQRKGNYPNIKIVIAEDGGSIVNVSDAELESNGLEATFKLSSSKWTPFTWTFSSTAYLWSLDDNTGATYYYSNGERKPDEEP